jgi:hypothetical protein
MQGTLTIEQNGDAFTGTMTTDFGSATISDGEISGRTISWSISINAGGQAITVTYQGQVDGDRITGRATAGDFGSFPFSAQRRP